MEPAKKTDLLEYTPDKQESITQSQDELQNPKNSWDMDIAMLNYFQNEWIYRHTHFWKIAIKLFLFNSIVTILPYVSTAFGVAIHVDNFNPYLFPILGFIITFVTFYILNDESKKLTAVGQTKYRINGAMEEKYRYLNYTDKSETAPLYNPASKNNKKVFRNKKLIFAVTDIMCSSQILIEIIISIFIFRSKMLP